MAHLIDFSNARANLAYVGETPWHGLGEKLPKNTDIDQWRIAAGLDWTVERNTVSYTDATGELRLFDGKQALFRSDTQAPLAVVSDRYQVVQPAEVLEFFRDLVADGGMRIETAGSLKGGKTIWALATNGASFSIGGVDMIKPYVLLSTSCDGSSATRAYFTTVRVVCNNTLSMSASDAASGVKVKHSTKFNAASVKSQLGLIDTRVAQFAGAADTLALKGFDDRQAVNFFAELYVKRDANGNVTNEKPLEKVVNQLMNLYKTGPGAELVTAHGTAWGAVNAVTHYVDFDAPSRNRDNRFTSAQFGAGATLKDDAVKLALAA